MKNSTILFVFLIIIGFLPVAKTVAQSALIVKANQPLAEVQSTLWGIFFEDINFGADGGIYAELVKNRSFEFSMPLMGWKEQKSGGTSGSVLILNRGKENLANPRFARVSSDSKNCDYGLVNEGFRGMGIKKGAQYHFSVLAKQSGNAPLSIRILLKNQKGDKIAEASLSPSGDQWKKYSVSFVASETEAKANLYLGFVGNGSLDLDMVSLFPNDTWKQRPGGLRADLVQLLADMKPGFLRFPGGCIVEGRDLANRYQWKKTVGKTEEREVIINRWNTEFNHRPAPDYFQSYGLGFFEYFLLSEDIGAEPLPIINCGMACQFNTSEVVPLEQLDPYLQDALDLIEFANGSTDTKWGKLRADLGHPNPFNMKLLGIGNEQWGPQYVERYKVFVKTVKDKYPSVKLVTSVGPSPDGELFDYLDPTFRSMNVDILDEHYYKSPDWFLQNAKRYDNYDRKGPKIFAGEYAAQSAATASPENKNNWKCALSEAAFMTGLERNADVVYMSSYAPLFAHAEGWQWTPDLIWFDNLRAYGTPNYYVQKLFSSNKGSAVVPVLLNKVAVTGQEGVYASAVKDKNSGEIIIKVINTSDKNLSRDVLIEGVSRLNSKGSVTVLKSDLGSENSLENPQSIYPKDEVLNVKGNKVILSLAPYSMNVVRVKAL